MNVALASNSSNSPGLHSCIMATLWGWYTPKVIAWCLNAWLASYSPVLHQDSNGYKVLRHHAALIVLRTCHNMYMERFVVYHSQDIRTMNWLFPHLNPLFWLDFTKTLSALYPPTSYLHFFLSVLSFKTCARGCADHPFRLDCNPIETHLLIKTLKSFQKH